MNNEEKDQEKKDAYRQKIEAQLEEWEAQIDVVKARAKKAGADARLHLDRQLEDLRARREDLRERLKEMQKSGGDAWHKMRDGIDKAAGELKHAWEKVKERF